MYTAYNFSISEGGVQVRVYERMRAIVRSRKETQGQTQKFLARKCGFSEKNFSMIINGRKPISDIDVGKFCTGMDVTPNEVYGYSDTA